MISFIMRCFRKYRELILYLVFGVLTTILNYIAYYLFTRAISLPLVTSNILAWIMAVAFAYVTNRRWVFGSKATGAAAIFSEMSAFVAARVFSGVVDTACMVLLVDWLSLNDMIAKILVNILVIAINYILSKLVIFRKV